MTPSIKYHFFVSYTNREEDQRELRPLLNEIGRAFRSIGLVPAPFFWDKLVLEPGTDVERVSDELVSAIDQSICMLAIVSPAYLGSPWCAFEWGAMAATQRKRALKQPLIRPYFWKSAKNADPFVRQVPYGTIDVDVDCLVKTHPSSPGIRIPYLSDHLHRLEKQKLERFIADALAFIARCHEELGQSVDVALEPDAEAVRSMAGALAAGAPLEDVARRALSAWR